MPAVHIPSPHHPTLFCTDGFFGGDCSLRVCPAGKGFVDTPRGDLNHNGQTEATGYSIVQGKPRNYQQYESWPNSATQGGWAAQAGESHFQVECSGKGSCDRTMGVCKCFDGYTGASCQRSECVGRGTFFLRRGNTCAYGQHPCPVF